MPVGYQSGGYQSEATAAGGPAKGTYRGAWMPQALYVLLCVFVFGDRSGSSTRGPLDFVKSSSSVLCRPMWLFWKWERWPAMAGSYLGPSLVQFLSHFDERHV